MACRVCGEFNYFPNNVQNNISLDKTNRKLPKDRTGRKAAIKHIVDDNYHAYEYGKEEHARMATGSPHKTSCYISGRFRFGKRINSLRHYNVSSVDKNTISGNFHDCHHDNHEVRSVTHLNMFSNDYFA